MNRNFEMRAAAGLICFGVMFGAGAAQAGVVFSDNFNSYTTSAAPLVQYATGLNAYYNGTLSNFTGSGGNANLAIDRTGNGDYAVALYGGATGMAQDSTSYNAISLTTPVAANTAGVTYTVSVDYAPGVFNAASQQTVAGNYLVFQLMDAAGTNFANNSLVMPAFTATAANPLNPFMTYTFTYVGDGVGNLGLNIFGVTSADTFAGEIDNLVISTPTIVAAVPEPASLALIGLGLAGAGLVRRRRQAAI